VSLFDVETGPVPENWNPFGEEFAEPVSDAPSDGRRKPGFDERTGRYNDLPPVPGYEKVKTWMRVTTLKSTLEDQWRLEAWKRRQVIMGIKREPKLLGEIGPQLDPSTKYGRAKLDQLVERAIEIAGSHEGRERGSDLHEIIEAEQNGSLGLEELDEERRVWLDGYRRCLRAGGVTLLPEYSERTVVIPEIGCAGTLDTIADDNGILRIGDLKTQKWEPGAFDRISLCAQLASYSRAAFMLDTESWTWKAMPQVNQEIGVIIWAPAVEPGKAEIYEVDLSFGWEMVLESLKTRANRNRKGVVTKRSSTT
jgi:hypothetical protein